MTFCPSVRQTLASPRRVPPPVWPPPQLFGDPAYLSPAVGAPYPVTSPLFEQQNLAAGTVEGFARPDQSVYPVLGLLHVLVRGLVERVLLVLLAVHTVVYGLAGDAVVPLAQRALEHVCRVLDDGPTSTVGGLAVERVLGGGLGLFQRLLL